MPRRLAALLAPPLTALTLLGTSCVANDDALPGDAIGQYAVRGTLEHNACGAGYEAPSQLWFHVELRRTEGSTIAYWKLPDTGIAQGTVQDGVYRFVDRQEVVAIDGEPDIGVPGCVLERVETVALSLHGEVADGGAIDAGTQDDGGAPTDGGLGDGGATLSPGVERFTGTTTVLVGAVSGGDCSALLEIYGGPFPTLPCEMRFALSGDRLEEELW